MGACVCKGKVHQSLHEYICNSLLLAIENGSRTEVERMYTRFMKPPNPEEEPLFHIDETVIVLQEVALNALAYAFRAGQCDVAKFLIEVGNASIGKLYATYQQIGRTPVDILCEFGFLELIQYFLPIHLHQNVKPPSPMSPHESLEELSIFSEIKHRTTTLNPEATMRVGSLYQPAIHRACEHGHIDVVKWLFFHFKGKSPPIEFDINAVDEKAGENCALISARSGNLAMIRFLFEVCEVDFHRLNRRRENAIQVAVTGSKRKQDVSYLSVLKYLVEVVGVDVTYEYEETLLICEDKTLIFYLENQLHQRGITVTKSKVDLDNSFTRNRPRRQMSKKSQELEQKCRYIGTKFTLKDLFPENSKYEDISSIPVVSDNSPGRVTPI